MPTAALEPEPRCLSQSAVRGGYGPELSGLATELDG